MSTRTTYSSEAALFYITFTCTQWLPLFELVNGSARFYVKNKKDGFVPLHYEELS